MNKLKSFFQRNSFEVLFGIICLTLIVIPHSIEQRQYWKNLLPLKYTYLIFFILFSFLYTKKIFQFLKKNFIYLLILSFFFVLQYFRTKTIEFSYIALMMTFICLGVTTEFSIKSPKNTKYLTYISWLVAASLLIKFPFLNWANSRYNFGLGNPNHAGFILSSLLLFFIIRKNYWISFTLVLSIFIIKSYAAILTAFFIVVSQFLLKKTPLKNLIQYFYFFTFPLYCLVFFLLFSFIFHLKFTSSELNIFKSTLLQNSTIHTPNVIKQSSNHVKLDYKSKIFDLSGYTRVYQLELFIQTYQKFLITGDEETFIKPTSLTMHNNILGLIVIFGLPISLMYLIFLSQLLNQHETVYLCLFSPIFGSDTAVSFYSIYFVLLFIIIKSLNLKVKK